MIGLVVCLILIFLPSHTIQPGKRIWPLLLKIDWLGAMLHTATCVLGITALLTSGTLWEWSSPQSITLWVLFGVALGSYVAQQATCFTTASSLRNFPVTFAADRTSGLVLLATGCTCIAYGLVLYYLPLYYAFARGFSPVESSVHLLAFLCVFIAATMLAGALLPIIRRYAPLYFLAGALLLTGHALLSNTLRNTTTLNENTLDSRVLGFQAVTALGAGLVFNHSFSILNVRLGKTTEAGIHDEVVNRNGAIPRCRRDDPHSNDVGNRVRKDRLDAVAAVNFVQMAFSLPSLSAFRVFVPKLGHTASSCRVGIHLRGTLWSAARANYRQRHSINAVRYRTGGNSESGEPGPGRTAAESCNRGSYRRCIQAAVHGHNSRRLNYSDLVSHALGELRFQGSARGKKR